jgi:transposase
MKAEILVGPERRRRWSAEEKARIVAETAAPGAQVAEVARRHGLSRGLLYLWRSAVRRGEAAVRLPKFVPAVLTAASGAAMSALPRAAPEGGMIEIALGADVRVTLHGRVDAKGLRSVLTALRADRRPPGAP